jgi:hypothetical protein
MSGSSHGITEHIFVGARVGTSDKIKMFYTPAHIRPDGKPVSARLVVPILVNEYGKSDPDSYRLIAWGALADLFAKNLSQGKEMTFFCEGSSYWGNVTYKDGMQVMQKDGSGPVQTRQISFTIRRFTWGGDSNRTIIEETQAGMKSGEGRRPAQWNIPGSPDNMVWKQLLERRKQTFYQGGTQFGYATVVAPRGGGQVLVGDQSKILRTHAQANVNAGGNNGLVNQVHNTFNPNPGAGLPAAVNPSGYTAPPVYNANPANAGGLPAYNTHPA